MWGFLLELSIPSELIYSIQGNQSPLVSVERKRRNGVGDSEKYLCEIPSTFFYSETQIHSQTRS